VLFRSQLTVNQSSEFAQHFVEVAKDDPSTLAHKKALNCVLRIFHELSEAFRQHILENWTQTTLLNLQWTSACRSRGWTNPLRCLT
jgi:hypothetical protein